MSSCRRPRPPYAPKGPASLLASILLHGWLFIAVLLVLLPFAWSFFISLCPGYSLSDLGLGRGYGLSLRHYSGFLRQYRIYTTSSTGGFTFLSCLANTLLLSLASSFGSVFLGSLAGSAASSLPSRRRKAAFVLVFIGLLLPGASLLSSLYQGLRALEGLYSLLPYSALSIGVALPFGAFIMYSAIRRIPRSTSEAAILDGASGLRLYRSVHLPLCLPAIGYAALIGFFLPWFDAITQFTILFPVRATLSLYLWSLSDNLPQGFSAGAFIVGVPVAACMILTWRYALRASPLRANDR